MKCLQRNGSIRKFVMDEHSCYTWMAHAGLSVIQKYAVYIQQVKTTMFCLRPKEVSQYFLQVQKKSVIFMNISQDISRTTGTNRLVCISMHFQCLSQIQPWYYTILIFLRIFWKTDSIVHTWQLCRVNLTRMECGL